MYPEHLTTPMKMELTDNGFADLKTAAQVEEAIAQPGTTLLVINSVCGCAAGTCRPGVLHAVATSPKKPTHLTTAFAGVDPEAVAKARELMLPYPPSSPSIALFKDGELVHFVERHHIEGRSAEMIAEHLVAVFDEYVD
ncbi:BrxA/BrxB family bacilliredoxin [Flammeovirga kamogawensis]|uniref:BrxA/BrxB family bacilliredoxin n=1 Tax=Flammeovirga kamogawensis TaxID=373891 RepID=A0ABX8GQP0_9BACT|nr:BrxA/BrxB family bacilliredoxin [Flammeovirga kamogawensis]MBB6462160.1 putative YphP/YqiW family bacilliredoxin [Flammeovirga kamogawensis]QWG05893.1 BrxA/BrxB family bacilliredoxin [Flammeovirga kamogawensis]TRX67718.1 BrxA/BrxB family bacilliredoxin [Flammeovirga kamogawensis]